MKLYSRDYCVEPTKSEISEYEEILKEEKANARIGRKILCYKYPEAIRHYNSLFPNNHIELFDCKSTGKMDELIEDFTKIVHNENSKERDILNFINHKQAYFIIGSVLTRENFGHHEAYIFPEFSIGNGKYFADYLIVGKNSGGYEFIFIELEAPNKRITIKDGYEGQAMRLGLNQIFDWKCEIEANYSLIKQEFEKQSKKTSVLPIEFQKLDQTRIHYVVVAGVRDDYNDTTYRNRRLKLKEQDIKIYHYDNLIDFSTELEERATF